MPDLATPAGWLPVVFLLLMGLAMLIYVVLDGYDLGVGILLRSATDAQKDTMIASIGPFWDANETWLVLGIGILLTAFPKAHGVVLTELYLPVALMLIGLILRGVAFDFRVKAQAARKPMWDRAFFAGSTLAAASQGWMLGRYVSGFGSGWNYPLFAAATRTRCSSPCSLRATDTSRCVSRSSPRSRQRTADAGASGSPTPFVNTGSAVSYPPCGKPAA